MSLLDTLKVSREEIIALASSYGASELRCFGSVVRRQERPDSDIDLLVRFEPGRSLMDHAGLKIALEELLGRPVDIASERGLKPRFRERILAEAVSL
jgi:predicted nucleotidyltransferase